MPAVPEKPWCAMCPGRICSVVCSNGQHRRNKGCVHALERVRDRRGRKRALLTWRMRSRERMRMLLHALRASSHRE